MLLTLSIVLTLAENSIPAADMNPVLISVDPVSGGKSGGTVITVRGEQFMEGSTCVFEDPTLGSAVSQLTTLHNSSYLVCFMPALDYIDTISTDGHFIDLSVASVLDSRSNSITFLVYDITAMVIYAISPSEGLHYVPNNITVYGDGFLGTNEQACHISSKSTTYVFPAIFISQNVLECTLPALPSPTLKAINVSLNRQEATYIPTLQNSTLFTFTAAPPNIITAKFNSAFTGVYLAFDREVELGGVAVPQAPISINNCAMLFSLETIAVLGAGAECEWRNTQQREITIYLPHSSKAMENTVLTLLNDTIRTRHTKFSRLASGNINITLPSSPLTPLAVLEAPQNIPQCGGFALNGKPSQGGGYAPLLYHWDITAREGINLSLIKDFLPAGYSSFPWIIIKSELFQRHTVYTVHLTVRNSFGIESSSSHVASLSVSNFLPLLTNGGSTQAVCAHHTVILELSMVDVLPECSNYTQSSNLQWTVLNDSLMNLNVKINSSVLRLPPYTLLHNQMYTVQVKTEHENINASFLLRVKSCLAAHISGADYKEINQTVTLLLDGSRSEGLSIAIASDPLFHPEWICSFNGLPCLNQEGIWMQFPANITLSIPPNTLLIGTYTFMLSLHYNNSVVSVAESIIKVINDSAPLLEVFIPKCCGPHLIHTNLTVLATVYSRQFSSVQWTVESVPGYGELDLTPHVTSSPLSLPIVTFNETISLACSESLLPNVTNQIALKIFGGVLLKDNKYRISLQAFDKQQHLLSESYVDICTSLAPSHGVVSVEHMNITPDSVLRFRADGWVDTPSNTPLLYRFGLKWSENASANQCAEMQIIDSLCYEKIIWISGYSLDPCLETMFLQYVMNYLVIVEVINNQGAVAVACSQVNVSTPKDEITVLDVLRNVERKIREEGRWKEGMATLALLLEDKLISSSAEVIIVEMLIHIFNDHLPTSISHLTLLLSLLNKAAINLHLPPSTALQATSVVTDIMAMLNTDSSSNENIGFSFSEKISTASAALDTLLRFTLEYSTNVEQGRIQAGVFSSKFVLSVPIVGYGVCQQLNLGESELHSIGDEVSLILKISRSQLVSGYSTGKMCDNERCSEVECGNDVIVNFGSKPFSNYFQWECEDPNPISGFESMCFGMCIVSTLLDLDLHWLGNQYTHHVVSHILTLSLLNPFNGHSVTTQLDTIMLEFIRSSRPLNYRGLYCAIWDVDKLAWNINKCNTLTVGGYSVTCSCEFKGSVDVALVQVCPSGHYGRNCTEECPQGLWGEECAEPCHCNQHGMCSASTGSCDCDPGFMGKNCQEECEAGMYGKRCAESCLCVNAASCDNVSGSCDCKPGWTGHLCETECSNGTYGYYCMQKCQCREHRECQKEDGVCVCDAGYTGDLCLDPCSEGTFGLNCLARCECSAPGTVSCHHITGNCSCHANYTGTICDEIIPMSSDEESIPVVVPVMTVVIVIASISVIVAIIIFFWRQHKMKKVHPFSNSHTSNRVVSEECSRLEGNHDRLNLTHAESLEVVVPRGKELQELFPQKQSDDDVFQEPPRAHTKLRWQVVQVVSKEMRFITTDIANTKELDVEIELFPSNLSHSSQGTTAPSGEKVQNDIANGGESGDRAVMVYYRRGIYLNPDATLKDLRNAFLDSGQLEENNRFLQFLRSDVPGDSITIETEDETYLSDLESNLVELHTIHFQLIEEDGHPDLCVCGRYADLECSECHSQGYCSPSCQTQHWLQHIHSCRAVSERKIRHKKKSKYRDKQKSAVSINVSPSNDLCPCGKVAEFDCSQCDIKGYCSEKCQLDNWPQHQRICHKKHVSL